MQDLNFLENEPSNFYTIFVIFAERFVSFFKKVDPFDEKGRPFSDNR